MVLLSVFFCFILGTTYFVMNQKEKGLEYYLKAHKIYAKVYGDEDSDTNEVCGNIARTYILMEFIKLYILSNCISSLKFWRFLLEHAPYKYVITMFFLDLEKS